MGIVTSLSLSGVSVIEPAAPGFDAVRVTGCPEGTSTSQGLRLQTSLLPDAELCVITKLSFVT